MAKHSFNISDCIHEYAQQTNTHGKASNVYFEGAKIWSYGRHFLLGEFIEHDKGKYIVINDIRYSNSTSKHQNKLIAATRQYKQFFKSNIQILQPLKSLLDKLKNARKPELYLSQGQRLIIAYKAYCDYIGQKYDKEIKALFPLFEGEAYKDYAEKLKAMEAKELKEIMTIGKRAYLKDIEAWQNFVSYENRPKHSPKEQSFKDKYKHSVGRLDYLRLNKNTSEIETSQGVRIPINEGKRLFNLIKRGANIVGDTVDKRFKVDKFNGVMVVGCHTIDKGEILRMGALIENL